mmetsp:Transcript_9067/g.27255  ORF Transcript_9067/g.27255 Transcript_9067/m.27255 type:complete len:159 (-) Transcript_9067:2786-3262(-)
MAFVVSTAGRRVRKERMCCAAGMLGFRVEVASQDKPHRLRIQGYSNQQRDRFVKEVADQVSELSGFVKHNYLEHKLLPTGSHGVIRNNLVCIIRVPKAAQTHSVASLLARLDNTFVVKVDLLSKISEGFADDKKNKDELREEEEAREDEDRYQYNCYI